MPDESDLARRRWLILMSTVVSFFAVGTTFFAVPPLVAQLTTSFALDNLHIGVLMGAIAIPAIFISIPLGAAIDRWPARAAGVIGLSVMATGATIFAVAPDYGLLVAGRIVFGVGGLTMNLLLARLVTTAFRDHELSFAMGVFNSVYPASMIVMFSLHPRMLAAFGWRGELLLLAGLALLAVPLHAIAVPARFRGADSTEEETSTDGRLPASLMALAVAWALFFGVYASVFTFAAEAMGGGGRALLTVSLIAWTALVLAPAVGVVIDRIGHPERWLAAGLVLLGLVLAGMSVGLLPSAVAMAAIGVAVATSLTATYSLPGRIVAATRVGFAFGFITAFSNLATLAGPAATGAVSDVSDGWAVPWLVLASASFLGAATTIFIRPRSPAAASGR
jgi:DHA1 family inner membrane transport protein